MKRPVLLLSSIALLTTAQAQWTYDLAVQSTSANVEQATNCAVAADGHVAVTGIFTTDLHIGTFTGDGAPGNGTRGFVAYYDANGTLEWAHILSCWHQSGGSCQAWDAAIDDDGNVVVGGQFNDSLLLDGVKVAVAPNDALDGARVFHAVKFGPTGDLVWASAVAVEGFTGFLQAVAVDHQGDVYLAGQGGNQYGRFIKLNGGSGAVLFSYLTDGAGGEVGDLAVDANDNVYITGQASNQFNMGGMTCPYNNALGGGSTPLFVGKFNSAGAAQWYYVPDQTGSGYFSFPEGNIAVSADGNVYVETRKRIRINGDTMNDGNGSTRALFALDPDGGIRWARHLNNTGQLAINDMRCDSHGNVLLLGQTYGPTLDLVDTTITSSTNNFNVFLGRYAGSTGALDELLNGPAVTNAMGLGLDDDDTPWISGTFSGSINMGDPLDGTWDMFLTRLHESLTGIAERRANDNWQLYPNPANGTFRVSGPGTAWDLDVLDARGAVVHAERITTPMAEIDLDAPAGLYLVRARDAKGHTSTVRLVVEH